ACGSEGGGCGVEIVTRWWCSCDSGEGENDGGSSGGCRRGGMVTGKWPAEIWQRGWWCWLLDGDGAAVERVTAAVDGGYGGGGGEWWRVT
nr:hypothetical protein [Tanacetum cinerariifolium]